MTGSSFDINGVIQDALQMVSRPVEFYRRMPHTGGYVEPIIFLVVMAFVAGVILTVFSLFGTDLVGSMAIGVWVIVMFPIMALIGSFMGAAILFVIQPLAIFKTFTECGSLFLNNIVEVAREHSPVFLIMLAFLPLAIYDSIKLSHKFAGPIYRLRKDLARLQQGEDVQFSFRKDDFWTDIPDSMNSLVAKIDDLEAKVAEELERDSIASW